MEQLGLIPLDTLPPKIKYGLLFEHLPSLCLREKARGRRPFPRDALLKALIYKALRRVNDHALPGGALKGGGKLPLLSPPYLYPIIEMLFV